MSNISAQRTNRYSLCTLDTDSDCSSCSNHGRLACKWDKGLKNTFSIIGSAPVLTTLLGLVAAGILTGAWWPIPAYLAYFLIMFNVFEIRFLCSHCPYYPDGGNTLRCLANHGSPKLWKYHPEPMNRFERFMMRFGVMGMIFFILPALSLAVGPLRILFGRTDLPMEVGFALALFVPATLMAGYSFLRTVNKFYCTSCVNFSCPYNRVPKKVVDDYLAKNTVMREAWEKSGYKLG